MNKMKQFWALFRFQTTVNPFIWFMPVAFGMPFFFASPLSGLYTPDLSSVLRVQNLFFVGIFGAMILAPEKFQYGSRTTTWNSGAEFLLTRAIDRPLLYRSKALFLYTLVLMIPLLAIFYSLKNPDLKVTEYSNEARQQCLVSVPGSKLEPNPDGSRSPLISIPGGSMLVAEWQFWQFVVFALGVQALILFFYPFKWGSLIFYIVYMGSIFLPLFFDLHHASRGVPSSMEHLFFAFAAHPFAFWILTGIAIILGQIWAERRFAKLEQ